MKNFLLFVFSVGTLGISALAFYATHEFLSPGPLQQTKDVIIPKGTGILEMARELQREGVISDQYVFIAYSRLTQSYKRLQAGEYEFPAHATMTHVMSKIASGDIIKRSVTVPEGKTSFEVVAILNKVPALAGDIAQIPPEGSLLPSTYDYKSNETKESLVKRMQKDLKFQVLDACGYLHDAIDADSINQMGFDEFMALPCPENNTGWAFKNVQPDIRHILTLASIVEKETGVASERARIAGVFFNRLDINMPLQSDPTVIYGITRGENKNEGQGPLGRRLLIADLEKPTPYNTYTNAGLPPGPIGNSGLASIEAVLHPEKNNFLFFVADGKGGHIFAATLAEHNQNVANWRQIRKEQDGK